jgi:hypothetical protein
VRIDNPPSALAGATKPKLTFYASDYATLQQAIDAAKGQTLYIDKSPIVEHVSLIGSTYDHTHIIGMGRGVTILQPDNTTDVVMDIRASYCTVEHLTIDGSPHTSCPGLLAFGTHTGDGASYAVETKLQYLVLENISTVALNIAQNSWDSSVDHVRIEDGITGQAVVLDSSTGPASDSGQLSFYDCQMSAGKESVTRSGTTGSMHRFLFERCGFQAGKDAASGYMVQLNLVNDATFISCDFETTAGNPPATAILRVAGQSANFIGCQFYVKTNACDAVSINTTYGPAVFLGCRFDGVPAGHYCITGAAKVWGLNTCYIAALAGTIADSEILPEQTKSTAGNTASIPSGAAWQDGYFELYHDSQASHYYLVARCDGATKKVELT